MFLECVKTCLKYERSPVILYTKIVRKMVCAHILARTALRTTSREMDVVEKRTGRFVCATGAIKPARQCPSPGWTTTNGDDYLHGAAWRLSDNLVKSDVVLKNHEQDTN